MTWKCSCRQASTQPCTPLYLPPHTLRSPVLAPSHHTPAPLQFDSTAISARSGRKRTTFTGKELKKDMEVFLQTGVHPHLQRVQQQAASGDDVLTALPDPDPSRPHVFMDITVDNKPAGARGGSCSSSGGGSSSSGGGGSTQYCCGTTAYVEQVCC